jgi:hypothetical protein
MDSGTFAPSHPFAFNWNSGRRANRVARSRPKLTPVAAPAAEASTAEVVRAVPLWRQAWQFVGDGMTAWATAGAIIPQDPERSVIR